eukprot:4755519-Prymnesium_polylepis.1
MPQLGQRCRVSRGGPRPQKHMRVCNRRDRTQRRHVLKAQHLVGLQVAALEREQVERQSALTARVELVVARKLGRVVPQYPCASRSAHVHATAHGVSARALQLLQMRLRGGNAVTRTHSWHTAMILTVFDATAKLIWRKRRLDGSTTPPRNVTKYIVVVGQAARNAPRLVSLIVLVPLRRPPRVEPLRDVGCLLPGVRL